MNNLAAQVWRLIAERQDSKPNEDFYESGPLSPALVLTIDGEDCWSCNERIYKALKTFSSFILDSPEHSAIDLHSTYVYLRIFELGFCAVVADLWIPTVSVEPEKLISFVSSHFLDDGFERASSALPEARRKISEADLLSRFITSSSREISRTSLIELFDV